MTEVALSTRDLAVVITTMLVPVCHRPAAAALSRPGKRCGRARGYMALLRRHPEDITQVRCVGRRLSGWEVAQALRAEAARERSRSG